jgi:hypothetical protein
MRTNIIWLFGTSTTQIDASASIASKKHPWALDGVESIPH